MALKISSLGGFLIPSTNHGYTVYCESDNDFFTKEIYAENEYQAVTKALALCGEEWKGLITVDDNSNFGIEPLLQFEFHGCD